MNERWPYAVLSLVGLAAAAVLIGWAFRPREPVYQGEPLSYWLDQLSSPGASQEEAKVALGGADAKAVAFLLEKVRHGGGTRASSNPWASLPPGLQALMPAPEFQRALREEKIPYALSLMGPAGVPALIGALQDTNSKVQAVAARALAMMGSRAGQALPKVIPLINHTNGEVRLSAVFALHQLGGQKEEAIRALVTALGDSNRDPSGTVYVRESAARALGHIGPNAAPAVPTLTALLDDPDSYTRREAALALWRIQRDTNMVGRLMGELEKPKVGIHQYKAFLWVLGEMGPAASPAIPTILRSMTNWGTDMSRVIRPVLLKIDPAAAKGLTQSSTRGLN